MRTGFRFCFLAWAVGSILTKSAHGQALEILYRFGVEGARPLASPDGAVPTGLAKGSDGHFYGTTIFGGDLTLNDGFGHGTFFRVTAAGEFKTLANFGGDHVRGGGVASLIEARNGDFYGVAPAFAAFEHGCIYKVTKAGVITKLATFNGQNGSDARGTLVEGMDGSFYGTTYGGGTDDSGTVFKLTTDNEIVTLVNFNGENGARPEAGLLLARDGNFYGTCEQGGFLSLGNWGTLFRMTPGGTLTTLVYLANNRTNGIRPMSPLTQGFDGNLYGTTGEGGTSAHERSLGLGTLFKLTLDGQLQTLVSFDGTDDGMMPHGVQLLQGSNGVFYGTTYYGGPKTNGTVFQISATGELTTLAAFDGQNGRSLWSGVVQGNDGHLYGSASYGGPYDGGVIYRVAMPILSSRLDNGQVVVSWKTNQEGFTLQSAETPDSLNWTDHAEPSADGAEFHVTNSITTGLFFRLKK